MIFVYSHKREGFKVLFSAFFVLISIFNGLELGAQNLNMAALNRLDEELDSKGQYVAEKEEAINEIKHRFNKAGALTPSKRFNLYKKLYSRYQGFIYDSAFDYARKLNQTAYILKDNEKIAYSKLQLGFSLLSAGMFKETFDTLKTVSFKNLPDSSKVNYCSVMARTLYDISDYNNDSYYSELYGNRAKKYIDLGTKLSDPRSYDFLYLNSLFHLRNENDSKALVYLDKILLDSIHLTHKQNAIATSTAAFIHLRKGDTTKAIDLLARASISDIKAANKETTAMTSLAELLYHRGNIDKAYKYINHAMDDANFYGAKQRKVQVGTIMPMISAAYVHDIDSQRRTLLKYLVGIAALSLITIVLAIITLYQFRKLRRKDLLVQKMNYDLQRTNNKLSEANKIKDEYIGYFFTINSEYLQKVEKFMRSLEEKLQWKKYDEIEYLMRRMDLNKERKNLYHSFDEVFLKIFPHFVEEFNAYFSEENKIKVDKDQKMSTELRIFALFRLGITDSTKIADILGYSVNTIYAYKSRVMNKANVSAEEFKRKIMEIQAK